MDTLEAWGGTGYIADIITGDDSKAIEIGLPLARLAQAQVIRDTMNGISGRISTLKTMRSRAVARVRSRRHQLEKIGRWGAN